MRWILVCVAACGSGDAAKLEERITKLEAKAKQAEMRAARLEGLVGPIDELALWWCPADGGACANQLVARGEYPDEIRRSAANAVQLSAAMCAGESKPSLPGRGAPCFMTRLVFCPMSTDIEPLASPVGGDCYASRQACAARAASLTKPDHRCVAYYDGKPVR
jgi:hypothetical protein